MGLESPISLVIRVESAHNLFVGCSPTRHGTPAQGGATTPPPGRALVEAYGTTNGYSYT